MVSIVHNLIENQTNLWTHPEQRSEMLKLVALTVCANVIGVTLLNNYPRAANPVALIAAAGCLALRNADYNVEREALLGAYALIYNTFSQNVFAYNVQLNPLVVSAFASAGVYVLISASMRGDRKS